MVDEESNDQSQEKSSLDLKSDLEALRSQLAEMNAQYQQGMQSIVDTVVSQTKTKEPSYEEDPYMTAEEKKIRALEAKVEELSKSSPKMTQDIIRRERELDNTVIRLAREFPEIQADPDIQKAVVAEHNKLGKSLQDTAEGYELAVQRAVQKVGLVPKSRRRSEDTEEYVASGRKSGSSSASTKKGKTKVSEKTLAFAAMLGRDINDPKVLEGLEKASERERWLKYE